MTGQAEWVLISQQDGVMEITLNRAERKNALNLAMYSKLADSIAEASTSDDIRAVLLRGSDGCFSSGNDLADFLKSSADVSSASPVVRFMRALTECPKPVVAAVDGVAVGIGTTLLLHCDLCYASPSASFRLPFVNLGLCPEYASSWLLPRLAGYAKAAEWLLLGEFFSADEALQAGLINAVVDNPLERATEQARKLAAQPPEAVAVTKKLLKQGVADSVANAMERELAAFEQALGGSEFKSAAEAFFDKRG